MAYGSAALDRQNNFNLIRIVAALCVLVSHAYPLALGPAAVEPLTGLLSISLGSLAVMVFFGISGFFIASSFENSRDLIVFCSARAARVVPALVFVSVLSVLVLGPSMTALPGASYWASAETWTYLPRTLALFHVRDSLPGLFAHNPYPVAVNGSLWTLRYEALCYGLAALLGSLTLFSRRGLGAFVALYTTLYLLDRLFDTSGHFQQLFALSLPFVIGLTFFTLRNIIFFNLSVAVTLCLLAYLTLETAFSRETLCIAVVYLTFYAGIIQSKPLMKYNSLGDYSYGTYIFGFPIEQTLAHAASGISPEALALSSAPATLACAVLSWHLIEKPALRRKERLSSFLSKAVAFVLSSGSTVTGAFGRPPRPGHGDSAAQPQEPS